MQKEYLSWTQKSKISNQKEVYLVLRSIMFLKMCRGVDRIDEDTFKQEMAKLKKKYQLFTSMIPNFELQKYCQQFSIPQEEIQGALSQLSDNRKNQVLIQKTQEQNNKSHFLFVEITSMFIEVGDFCSLNIGEARFLFERLQNRLNSVCAYLKSNEFSEKVKLLGKSVEQYIGSRAINEEMTQIQLDQLKLQVRGLFDLLAHLTRG